MDFLKKLLAPSPLDRPSATQALTHNFFAKIKNQENEIKLSNRFKQSIEEEEKSPIYAMKEYSTR